MVYLTSKEVGEQLGVSAIRVTQIMHHDLYEAPISGRGRRYLYKQSTVDALVTQRAYETNLANQKLIAKELRRADRPAEDYLTITEAAILSGLPKSVIESHVRPRYVRSCKFYFKDRVLRIPKDAKAIRAPGTKRKTICACGKLYNSSDGSTECHACRNKINPEDPYNIMVTQKKGTRKCPGGCGKLLFVGQHTCGSSACKERLRSNASGIDAAAYYGKFTL